MHLRQAGGDVWYRVVSRGAAAPPGGDEDALKEYFNLGGAHPLLEQMAAGWAAADPHFAKVHPYFLGERAASRHAGGALVLWMLGGLEG